MRLHALAIISCLSTLSVQSLRFATEPMTELPPIDDGTVSTCGCQSDYDCQKMPVCVFDIYKKAGTCGAGPRGPIGSCPCVSDYDCQKPLCVIDRYTKLGTCTTKPLGPTGPSPTPAPVLLPTGGSCCHTPRSVPTICEVNLLIDLLNLAISSNHKLAAQWLRLSFHDAGTFNTAGSVGGANGCLMTDPNFRLQPENGFLDLPINTLLAIKNVWEAHPDTCLQVSHADIIQFAGFFASLRQVPPAGIGSAKRNTLHQFEWGRIDEPNCDISWVNNLPGFSLGTPTGNIPLRCLMAGAEIKDKMMERNGFTAEESAALIGAHTIGLTRNSFGSSLAGPWVPSGGDSATPDGPKFDNSFHDFLANGIIANTVPGFATNDFPFDIVFPDWFKDVDADLNHLDTDIVLAFPSQNLGVHPDFHTFTNAFAADNALFLKVFFQALEKMSKLGVDVLLTAATPCTNCDGKGTISVDVVDVLLTDLGTAEADAELQLLQQLESDAIAQAVESDSTPVKEGEILSVDKALLEVQNFQFTDANLV